MTNISYIIITRNRPALLATCLASLALIIRKNDEIIIVDDASDKSSLAAAPSFTNIHSIRLDRHSGVAQARNTGIALASGEYCIFLDDDTEVIDLDPATLIDCADKNPNIGVIGLPLFYPGGKKQESVRAFPTMPAVLWRGTSLSKLFPNASWYAKYLNGNTKDWVLGAGMLVRTCLFRSVGIFNPSYTLVYDDVDFCRRVSRAGHSIEYWPHGHITHNYQRASAQSWWSLSRWNHIRSIIYFLLS